MFTTETLIHAGQTFLMLFGELFSLFIGISFVVALLQIYISQERIKRILTTPRKGLNSILGAALGAVTPFCSCSTIPVLVGLFKSGAPFCGAISFLLTSPILNPAILTLLVAFFGVKATIVYSAFTFVFAVVMGLVLDKAGFEKEVKNVTVKGGHQDGISWEKLQGTFWQKQWQAIKLSLKDAFGLFKGQVTDSDSCEIFCGSDQEWFFTERQRLTGCGPSAAANILFYIERKENADCCGKDRADLLSFMEEAWESVTPEKNGIPSTGLFLEKLEEYAKLHERSFHYSVLDISSQQSERPSLDTVTKFIRHGLRADIPIAFLNLDHGAEERLESWHWVTIAGMICSEDGQTVYVSICDEGMTKQINLKLWLETTVQGGGFVYFLPKD